MPLTWESWRYPSYFLFNNVQLASDLPFDWKGFATSVFYNVEILARPGRWFNDYTGLANLCLPVTAFVALRHRDRSTFHAWALLAVMAMGRLNDPQFGYSFARPIHLYVVFLAPVLAAFSVRWLNTPLRTGLLALFVGLYIQMAWFTVPHVRLVDEFDQPLIERLRGLDGNLIVLENSFHADVDVDPARRSEKRPVRHTLRGAAAGGNGAFLLRGAVGRMAVVALSPPGIRQRDVPWAAYRNGLDT